MNNDPAPGGVLSPERTGGVLERVGAQLAGCGQSMRDLQASLSAGLLASTGMDPALAQRIQDLDVVEQTMTSLSVFMAEFGARLPTLDEGQLDRLIATIPLAKLAGGLRASLPPCPIPSSSGDLEMF